MNCLVSNPTLHVLLVNLYVWQSRVEIEHYSVPYFNRITALEQNFR